MSFQLNFPAHFTQEIGNPTVGDCTSPETLSISLAVPAKSAGVFFPAGTRDSKQEKPVRRSLSCLAPAGHYLGFLTVPCILTLDLLVLSSSPCVRSLWKLWFPLLTGGRKGRKLQVNLCSESTGGLVTKGTHDRVCSGNIDKVRERMKGERERERNAFSYHPTYTSSFSLSLID